MLYAFGRRILQPFGRLLFHLKVEGAERFPKNGRIILCCNHRSVFDPILLALACPRQIRYMAKSELFEKHGKAIQKLFYALGAFPVHRDSGDMGSIKTAFALLKEDAVVGIFPQGTCVAQGVPFKPKAGAVLIAQKSKTAILPACISCKGNVRPLCRVTVKFGSPFFMRQAEGVPEKQLVRENAAKLAQKINDLLEETP